MKKLLDWLVNHLRLVVTLSVVAITLVVTGSIMLASYLSYKDYERQYDADDLEARAKVEPAPKGVDIIDNYASFNADGYVKSSKGYGKKLTAVAEDLTITQPSNIKESEIVEVEDIGGDAYIPCLKTDGSVAMAFEIEGQNTNADLLFRISSPYSKEEGDETIYGVKDLFSYINFKVNGIVIDGEVDLLNDSEDQQWHLLVMKNFALAEGKYVVEVSPITGKGEYMPDIRSISVLTNKVQASLVDVEDAE
jgi:hypothetical protein